VGISDERKWEFNAEQKIDAAARMMTGSPVLGLISIWSRLSGLG